ncbi:hypothetical protein QWZ10_12425 [Paracoccus cavernae]|uniref:Uncharacterized protein n=1 Tax=Paracoccus cavernae TaxID=1571207 RepID=A0ABT8DAM1_9RHOB|nr:hypothetical protein [Paracoccus cavernae]
MASGAGEGADSASGAPRTDSSEGGRGCAGVLAALAPTGPAPAAAAAIAWNSASDMVETSVIWIASSGWGRKNAPRSPPSRSD